MPSKLLLKFLMKISGERLKPCNNIKYTLIVQLCFVQHK